MGFAITCVILTSEPSPIVDTPMLVNIGGSDSDWWLLPSVTVTKTGVDSVVSGTSVIVLVAVGVFTLACTMPGVSLEPLSLERERGELGEGTGAGGAVVTADAGDDWVGEGGAPCVWASG